LLCVTALPHGLLKAFEDAHEVFDVRPFLFISEEHGELIDYFRIGDFEFVVDGVYSIVAALAEEMLDELVHGEIRGEGFDVLLELCEDVSVFLFLVLIVIEGMNVKVNLEEGNA
jgi:hypothetical protein